MKKVAGYILALLLFAISAKTVLAISPRPLTATKEGILKRYEVQQELREQKREEIREKIEQRKATIAARLKQVRRERIRHFFGLLSRRLKAAILRLERLITRIESRLAKIEEDNEDIDTTSIKENVDEAKTLLENAKAKLAAAEDSLESVLDSEDPKQAFSVIRETIREIVQLLIEARRILIHVIGDIKGLRVGTWRQPSPTPTP